jgi:hypothetical protein
VGIQARYQVPCTRPANSCRCPSARNPAQNLAIAPLGTWKPSFQFAKVTPRPPPGGYHINFAHRLSFTVQLLIPLHFSEASQDLTNPRVSLGRDSQCLWPFEFYRIPTPKVNTKTSRPNYPSMFFRHGHQSSPTCLLASSGCPSSDRIRTSPSPPHLCK